jgi:RNA polymerase sigma factor (TIGR02999 family)
LPLVYDELRRIAQHFMNNERPNHTLQATELVNEAYIKLLNQCEAHYEDRLHFLRVAALQMRRFLIDHARKVRPSKIGPLDETATIEADPIVDHSAVDDALKRLAAFDALGAEVVHLRYYGGMTVDDVSQDLGKPKRTIERAYANARAWLARELANSQ